MTQIICHHKGRYNFYSTISDGFRYVSSLSLEQLTQLIEDEQGQSGIEKLPERLRRAHQKGSSALNEANRAGDNEEYLSLDECIRRFLS
jgi:hypothetical protein